MKDFTSGSIPRLMVSFLVPLLLGNMLQAAYMMIDAIWAGRLLGPSGVAIVATGMPVIFFLSSFFAGIVIGASILAGQAFGSKNREALSDIVSTSVIATAALSLAVSIPGVIFCGHILRLITIPDSLFDGAHVFLALIIGGLVLSSLVQWFSAMMNAAGDSRTPFIILSASLAINAVLAPVLITGAHVFPPMGVAGLALSTIIANVISAVICVVVWRRHRLSEIAPFRLRIHLDTLKKITMVGFPLALQMLIVSSSFLFILSLANRFGADVTAAFGIGSRVDQFAFLATFAVTAAISAMSAQNIGAGRIERVAAITHWGVIFSLAFALPFCVAVMLFPDAVASLFTSDPAVIAFSRRYFHIAGISYLTIGVMFAYQGVLRGAGDTFPSFLIVASTMVLLRVPLCYYLSHYTALREAGLWAGITISSFAGAVAFYLYYTSGKWIERGNRIASPTTVIVNALESKALD